MARPRSILTLSALWSASMAAGLGAQQAQQPTCAVDETKPTQVGRALLYVEAARSAQAAGRVPDAAKQLTLAVKSLTEAPEKITNVPGRNLVLGKALTLWLNQPDVGYSPKRGALGYATNPEATIDLVAAIDSSLSVVEKVDPGCEAATAPWRAQKAWVTLVNTAIEHLNAERTDSAEVYAKRAMLLYSGSPFGHMVMGNIAQRRSADEAIAHYRAGVKAAGTDTLYAEGKRNILSSMGGVALEVADTVKDDATKKKYAAVATEAYEQLVKEFPTSPQAVNARAGLARVRLAAGDTAGFKATYQDQLQNPTKYTYHDLIAPAVAAARADQHADAAKLFENVLLLNPFNRDALYNTALMYHNLEQYDKMLPYIKRLVEIDPSNGENWRLYAYAYNGLAKALRPPVARTGTGARSGARAAAATRANPAVDAQVKAYNDSTVKYFEMFEKMPLKVEFTEWTNLAEKSTIVGAVENRGTTAKSYTVTLEFIDKSGAVLDTQVATVASVAPKAKGRFSVTSTKPGVVAFRYKPVT